MIRWSADAQRDLRRLEAFLAEKDPDAAKAAIGLIVEATDRLTLFPLSAPAFGAGKLRKLSIAGSYVALYLSRADHVFIARVHHASENWRNV